MSTRTPFIQAFATLLAAMTVVFPFAFSPALAQSSQAGVAGSNSLQAPTEAEVRARAARLIANQHKNDVILDQYERVEHELDTTGGANPRTLVDKRTRLEPNGAGTTKLLLEEGGHAVAPDEYRRELQTWVNVLQFMVNPNDERMKSATMKYAKRGQERSHLVDAILSAYTPKWAGREMRNGRDCDVFELTPDPAFQPHSIFESALPHATVKIWVDHSADQLVRAQALIISDFSVGGGVLGKLYKGGTFAMEQTEISPGVWLPSLYRFDFTGRKFLFSFEEHQSIEATLYRYIGTAKDAMSAAQTELTSGKPAAGDP